MTTALVNGLIHGHPRASAVLIKRGSIAGIGSGDLATLATDIIDLEGRPLLPGFQDSHVHPSMAGLELVTCHLLETPHTEQAYLSAIREYVNRSDKPWITGAGWSMEAFERGIPTAAALDAVVPDRPVMLWNSDHHGAWVNSKALEIAGFTAATPDPPDGRIDRDEHGNPIGSLQEGAVELILPFMPEPTAEERVDGILAGQEYLISLGITAWQDAMVEPATHDAYVALDGRGGLIADVIGGLWWERTQGAEQVEAFAARRESTPPGRYRATSVKMMLDGVAENYTASMLEPYRDADGNPTENRGIDFIDPDDLIRYVTMLDAAGFQVHFHALGDRAVRQGLDAIEAAIRANGDAKRRHHLAHIQVVDRADVPRFAALGAGANAQPLWARHEDQMDVLTIPFLDPTAAGHQYPWRSLLDAGAELAFGSDWNVSSPDPLLGIGTAVSRTRPTSRPEPFLPEQRITMDEAITAYTAGSAWMAHRETHTGRIEVGFDADLVVIDRPLETVEDAFAARVDLTMVKGDVVFER
ncbi:MAG: amidohydrolase [Acidimicrobiia bacterium]